ncbi:MAG TPA: hypothetical protein PKV38_14820, partial [bacterium]|nr:hypothetical protein [bacterium]
MIPAGGVHLKEGHSLTLILSWGKKKRYAKGIVSGLHVALFPLPSTIVELVRWKDQEWNDS